MTTLLSRVRSWLRAVLLRDAVQREIDEELRFHLLRETEEHLRVGHSESEARRRARAAFGAVEALREETRQAHGTYVFETTVQDARFAGRLLRANPGFTLTAVLTLALTIGAVSTVLTVAYALFRQPLPVPRPDEVVELAATRDDGASTGFVSYADYLHFRDGSTLVSNLAAVYSTSPLFIKQADGARAINGAVVSANFFSMLEIEPELGRFFAGDEDIVPDRDPVIVLGYDYWRVAFGSDESVLGRTLDVSGTQFTIVGVAPRGFHGVAVRPAQIFMPTMMLSVGYRRCSVLEDDNCTILAMYGRLRDGVSLAAARSEVDALVPQRWQASEPGDNSGATVLATRGTQPGPYESRFVGMLGTVAAVLFLVCCANLAGLLLSRTSSRSRELAIRTSLGAPRARIVRQLLTESIILAMGGGALGIALSIALAAVLQAKFYSADAVGRDLHFNFAVSPPIVLAVAGVSVLAGLLFGLLPALRSVGRGSAGDIRHRVATLMHSAASVRWLISVQVATALALIVVASLLASSAAQLVRGVNFDPTHVALMRLRPRALSYSPDAAQRYVRSVAAQLRALPGVESVSMVGTGVPLVGFDNNVSAAGGESSLHVGYIEVGPQYFETLAIEVLRGREFAAEDDATSPPVAVVSRTLADSLWPDGTAVGAGLLVNDRQHTVVGVVADVPLHNRSEALVPYVYVPFWQNPEQTDARFQVRVAGEPALMLPQLAGRARAQDPQVPVTELVPMAAWIAGNFRTLRMGASAVAYAGLVALLLSAIGLYSSLAAAVAQRKQEIGLRLAIGATARGILALIMRDGMTVVGGGILGGLGVAAVVVRLLQHFFYGTANGDALVMGAAASALTVVGLVACLVPAVRAARTEPMTALRAG